MGDLFKVLNAVPKFVNRGKHDSEFHDSKIPRNDGREIHTGPSDTKEFGMPAQVPYLTIRTTVDGIKKVWVRKSKLEPPAPGGMDATLTKLLDENDKNTKRQMLEHLEKQSELDATVVGAPCADDSQRGLLDAIRQAAHANISNSEEVKK